MSSTPPLVSVIVPAYNVEQWLPRCLESIAAQRHRHLEVLVVDDGSTDSSGDIARQMASRDSRFTVISKPNGGPSSARNAALDIARGPLLMMVDSDDVVPPTAVSDLLEALDSTGADIAAGQWVLFNDGDEPHFGQPASPVVNTLNSDQAIDAIFYQDGRLTCSPCARLYRREVFATLRFPDGRLYEDLDLAYPIYSQPNITVATTTAVVYAYRQKRRGSVLTEWTPTRVHVLDNLDALKQRLTASGNTRHLPAVRARRLAAALNLLALSPDGNDYAPLRERCMAAVRDERAACLTNTHVRTADRIAAAVSYAGQRLLRWLGRFSKR